MSVLESRQPNHSYTPVPSKSHGVPSNRDLFVLALHLAGYRASAIAELAGLSSAASVYAILRKEKVALARQQLLQGLELEFETYQRRVFEIITELMESEDPRVRLDAVDKWFRYFGKYKQSADPSKNQQVSAEDIVKSLLQVNVQVNVADRKNE